MKNPFTSTDHYFSQSVKILKANRRDVDTFLTLKGYEVSQREIYLKAYDHCCYNPEDYNGASLTEDLFDVHHLEMVSMLHDVLYVRDNASVSLKYMWKADKLLRSEMKRMGKSSWNTGARFVLLLLKTPVWIAWCWLIKGRRITEGQKLRMDSIFRQLKRTEKKAWHKEYQGELIWSCDRNSLNSETILVKWLLYIVLFSACTVRGQNLN